MKFDVECVKDCLLKNKMVFTVRKWKSYEKVALVEVPGVGVCIKERVRKVNSVDDIKNVVTLSGFDSPEAWWAKVSGFGAEDGWLYFVRIKEEASASSPIPDAPVTKVAFTGHRHLKYKDVESQLNKIHASHPGAVWITGGAIGLDSHAANYAMLHGIELWLILPFPPAVMTAKWSIPQKSFLDASIKYASKLSILSTIYNVRVYQDRNIRMVDLSDTLAAFWDGSPGGTGNCVGYARSVGHHIEMCLDGGASASSYTDAALYREVHGDIFSSDTEVIVNTVNCVGVMGRGIAMEFKKRYPDMFQAYREACFRNEISPGKVWVYHAKDGRIIFNCAVKAHWRNPSKIAWVESCLHELVQLCRSMNIKSIALPWMGAMNGWIPLDQIVSSTRKILSSVTDFRIAVYEIRGLSIPPITEEATPSSTNADLKDKLDQAPSYRPYCYLEHVDSCQTCNLASMEDLCKFKPTLVSEKALLKQKPAPTGTKKKNNVWIKAPIARLTSFRDNSRYIGYYDPESVEDAISEGIRVAPWEYRAYMEDPNTPRRIYTGDDAIVRESILDNSQPPEEDITNLVTPYDAGLDEDEEMNRDANPDMHEDGGFVPAFIFRTTSQERKVVLFGKDYKREPGTWMGFPCIVMRYERPGKPYYNWDNVPTLKPIGCRVVLKDGYVVPAGHYAKVSTIKTKADRKRAQDTGELARQKRAYRGWLIKKDAIEAKTGHPLQEIRRKKVATATF